MKFKNSSKTEDIVKRRSYYGFAVNYPGKLGSSKYVIGESRAVKKRESARKIIIAVLIVLVFAIAFVVTDICLNISEMPAQTESYVAGQVTPGEPQIQPVIP